MPERGTSRARSRLSHPGILVVAPGGRVQFISRSATSSLKNYFPPCAQRRLLPEPLAKWVASGDQSPYCRDNEGGRLIITFIDRSRKNSRAYLVREATATLASFTAREVRVLYWLSMGKTNADMGLILDLAPATIKKHIGSIFEKLGVENRTAAADYAREFFPAATSEPPPAA